MESLSTSSHHYFDMITKQDLPFEEDLIRHPTTLKPWMRYLEQSLSTPAPLVSQLALYERAVMALPGSYKIWKAYLSLLLSPVLGVLPSSDTIPPSTTTTITTSSSSSSSSSPSLLHPPSNTPSSLLPLPSSSFPSPPSINSITSTPTQTISESKLALASHSNSNPIRGHSSPLLKFPSNPSPLLKSILSRRVRLISVSSPKWKALNNAFERSLVLLHKCPLIWLMYLNVLLHQANPTLTRRAFDRALKSLPITQHPLIWELYLSWVSTLGVIQVSPRTLEDSLQGQIHGSEENERTPIPSIPVGGGGETCVRVWKRYLKFNPDDMEDYVETLLNLSPPRYPDAIESLVSLVENPRFKSKYGKSQYQLWTQLCDIICSHPEELEVQVLHSTDAHSTIGSQGGGSKFNVEKILRSGISRFTDQVGKLWVTLAQYFVLCGSFEKARDVFEEGIWKVMTVRDFSMVFDSYAEFEESLISEKLKRLATIELGDETLESGEKDIVGVEEDIDLDLRLARFELLMDRRPFLVNEVLLRQNPNNVGEWLKRASLYMTQTDPPSLSTKKKVIFTFNQAFSAVSIHKASEGKLQELYIAFAEWYERLGDLNSARQIWERAVQVPFARVDDLAEVWCSWAEMELRNDDFVKALELMGRATSFTPPLASSLSKSTNTSSLVKKASIRYNDESLPPQSRLFKSLKLWSFYVDLEESLGSVESTKAVYDAILDLKIATPQVTINFAAFMKEHGYWEDSFKVYERGISTFTFPVVYDIWTIYLSEFLSRYGGDKLERARDLFEQALEACPPATSYINSLYLLYAQMEETYGLSQRSMKVYDRATLSVGVSDRYSMYLLYIAKASSLFGLPATRVIFERALESLSDSDARNLSLRFHDMEVSLGETDRARGILSYASQFSDPRLDNEFWKKWNDFEVNFGNEDTFKEMLRIKRTIQTKFNTEMSFLTAQILTARQDKEKKAISTSQIGARVGEGRKGGDGGGGVMQSLEKMMDEDAEEEDSGENGQEELKSFSNETQSLKSSNSNLKMSQLGQGSMQFVKATSKTQNKATSDEEPKVVSLPLFERNVDEIDLDMDMDVREDDKLLKDDKQQSGVKTNSFISNIETQSIPQEVFGSLGSLVQEKSEGESPTLGARERFKRKRADDKTQ